MAASRDQDQFVAHPMTSQLPVHEDGLLVRDIGVLGAVDQERRRILGRDVADRTERVEGPGLGAGSRPATSLGQRPFCRQ